MPSTYTRALTPVLAPLKLVMERTERVINHPGARCFPIVPKLACLHLGIPIVHPSKPLTLLGGLTSFGGAGNNYSMHVCQPCHMLTRLCGRRKLTKRSARRSLKCLGKYGRGKSATASFSQTVEWCLTNTRSASRREKVDSVLSTPTVVTARILL